VRTLQRFDPIEIPAVKGLDTLDQLVPAVRTLGQRHAGYGVTDAHYDTVGGALYGVLATTMKSGARAAG
jgi:hemoglobin-like flavoprotein